MISVGNELNYETLRKTKFFDEAFFGLSLNCNKVAFLREVTQHNMVDDICGEPILYEFWNSSG